MKISELPDCPDWLASAETQNADVVWQNGTIEWHGGFWLGGVWRDGEWHGGFWLGGVWRGGEWRGEWLGKGEAPNAR